LSADIEKAIRTQFPKETGMPVASVVVPQSPASTKVEEGDVMIKVNGEYITQFVQLYLILDQIVENTIPETIERASENMDLEIDVDNTPD
jgi:S1-C subfamily serine protease